MYLILKYSPSNRYDEVIKMPEGLLIAACASVLFNGRNLSFNNKLKYVALYLLVSADKLSLNFISCSVQPVNEVVCSSGANTEYNFAVGSPLLLLQAMHYLSQEVILYSEMLEFSH